MKSEIISKELIFECKNRLLSMCADILNRLSTNKRELSVIEKMVGDEADQTVAQLEENNFLAKHERLRFQLLEIDYALLRIESGAFGVCEETQEPIEPQRLLVLPQTRLSIEGAEIRDCMNRKFAR